MILLLDGELCAMNERFGSKACDESEGSASKGAKVNMVRRMMRRVLMGREFNPALFYASAKRVVKSRMMDDYAIG